MASNGPDGRLVNWVFGDPDRVKLFVNGRPYLSFEDLALEAVGGLRLDVTPATASGTGHVWFLAQLGTRGFACSGVVDFAARSPAGSWALVLAIAAIPAVTTLGLANPSTTPPSRGGFWFDQASLS